MPKITVLMPVYNMEKYIHASIKSILEQTFKDFKLLIINDASTDNTLSIIHTFKDKRIKVINNIQNIGLRNCLNMSIKDIDSKYISRTDGDDISHIKRLELQYQALDNNPDYLFCGSWAERFYEDINEENRYIIKSPHTHEGIINNLFFCKTWGAHPLIRREVFSKHNIDYDFPEPSEDYRLYSLLRKYGKLMNIPQPLYHYRINPNGIYQQQIEKRKVLYAKIIKEQVEDLLQEEISEQKMNIHQSIIFQEEYVKSKENINETHHWLIRLLYANNKYKVYNKDLFSLQLAKYWLNIIQKSTQLGCYTWNIYITSPLRKYYPIGWQNNLLLLKNCFYKQKSEY